jgi:MFS family permease
MRTVFSPLQEAAKLDLRLSDFDISLVQGLAAGVPVAAVGIPLAWVIDHGNRARLLIALMVACIIGTLWTAFATGLTSLFVARFLSALGAGCSIGVIISMIADLAAPQRRGRSVVILALGAYAGTAAAFVLSGLLLTMLAKTPLPALGGMAPWRATHLLLGLAGTVLLFPLIFMREPARHEQEVTSSALGPTVRAIWAKRRFLIPLFIGQIGVSMADTAAGIWATPVLIREYHQKPADFGGWVGALILIAGILGSIVGGFSADFGQKSGRRGGLLFAAVAATAIGIPAALFPVMPALVGFQICFFFLLLAGAICSVVSSTAVTVLLPNEERGAAMAAFSLINALFGLSLAPTMVTFGSQLLGGEQHLGAALAITGVFTGIASFGGYLFAARNAPLSATENR